MTRLRLNILSRFAILLVLPIAAFPADSTLLQMMLPDAQVVAGVQADAAKNSLFGRYLLSNMPANGVKLEQFISASGFDPSRDLSEMMMSSAAGQNAPGRWIVAAHGTFDIAGITAVAQNNGGALTTYDGVQVITHTRTNSQVTTGLAFLNTSTALFGDLSSVQAAVDRNKSGASVNASILTQVQTASAGKDFWFITLTPLSNLSSQIPALNGATANNNNFFSGVDQASGGVALGDNVTFSAQAISRSPQDAQSLVDVVHFFVSLLQLNRQKDPAAGQLAALLGGLQTSVAGNTTTLSLSIPEPQLEQLLNAAHEQHLAHPRHIKASAVHVN